MAPQIGSFGNVLILLVMTLVRGTQRTGKAFVINLALADLCVAAIADPMCVTAVIKGEAWFNDKVWLCEAVASMCLTACFCAFLSLTLATLNRFVFICHNNWYERLFTKFTCVAACVGSWVVAFFFEFPNFLGWGGHYFDKKNHQCIWNRTNSFSYTLLVSAGLIGGPLTFMLLSHILIFRRIYRTKMSLYVFEEKDPTNKRKLWQEILRTSRMLLGIFCVFVVCWTPYSVVIVLDFSQRLSVEAHLFVTMLAHMHSSSNCLVYFIINPSFRKGVFRILGLSKCVTSGDISSTTYTESRGGDITKISDSKSVLRTTVSASSSSSNLTGKPTALDPSKSSGCEELPPGFSYLDSP
ncbi:hypothetical protein C0Q70_01988 [Pomacea canaliculata]|uniref:G-protein coupled receptors family 1 profile domain-containing protein n=1 Tax=Pomacea canaliculata TaxID=400727 RepID=A0A2T7Q116_POMCA|nr:hypothetical protein C0Q70_01988 [Pomacea canaliculata]